MQKEEGIYYDRYKYWPSTEDNKDNTGANGFIAVKELKKAFQGNVLGLRIDLSAGTKIFIKYVGQTKYWLEAYGVDENIGATGSFPGLDKPVEDKEKLNTIHAMLDDAKRLKKDANNNNKETDSVLQDLLDNISSDNITRVTNIGKIATKNLLREVQLQQIAAKEGIAPKIYGYNENLRQWCIAMEYLNQSVDDENKKYLDVNKVPVHARLQLVALCYKLDQLGIQHNDLKPNNYRIRNNRLYLVDFGKSKQFQGQIYSNMSCLSWGGWSRFPRIVYLFMKWFFDLTLEPLRLSEHKRYTPYNSEKAKKQQYNIDDVVLVDQDGIYMLYKCKKTIQQDEIFFPVLTETYNRGKLIMSISGFAKNMDTHNSRRLARYYLQLAEDVTQNINIWHRPAWDALWIHPTIPFRLEECLEFYNNNAWKMKKIKF